MSDFFKKFLLEDVRKMGQGAGRQVFLGAFGKHPGWDDHIEDIGLETGALVTAKTLLYVQGIGGQIDSGAWEKLDEISSIPEFKHVFIWSRAGQFLVGRMWASSDGKQRKRYPMVVCAHLAGLPLSWAISQVLPRLEELEQSCKAAQTAGEVRSVIATCLNNLRGAAAAATPEAATNRPLSPEQTKLLNQFAGPEREGLMRILYQIQSQMSAYLPGRLNPKTDLSGIRPQQIRLPAAAELPGQTLQLWNRFFLSQLDPAAPLLFTLPLQETWLDVTLGEPSAQEIYCLRASPKAMPLASEVPYNLAPEFKTKAAAMVEAFVDGSAVMTSGGEAGPAVDGAPAKSPIRKLLSAMGWGKDS
jgi:hypothetical protein